MKINTKWRLEFELKGRYLGIISPTKGKLLINIDNHEPELRKKSLTTEHYKNNFVINNFANATLPTRVWVDYPSHLAMTTALSGLVCPSMVKF